LREADLHVSSREIYGTQETLCSKTFIAVKLV
jgi:hypothetical protein